jgi:hypothetical protein
MQAILSNNGFYIAQRIGKYRGRGLFSPFNPPQPQDNFCDKTIVFRIIEMKQGAVNITFGYGDDRMPLTLSAFL